MQNLVLRALGLLCTISLGLCANAQPVFRHGVASGDPLPNAVILWTRVTPPTAAHGPVQVSWEVALDEHFSQIEQAGETMTGPERDFTVKIDAQGLQPGAFHYYRFAAFGQTSPMGRTKTAIGFSQQGPAVFANLSAPKNQKRSLPSPNDQVRLAVVSCSNYEAGYFNAYARIAEIEDLDAVVHLGDYIYEYAPRQYGDSTLQRSHLPENELLTLADYRTRYAQYRTDPDLQAAHRMHPFICVWDDHEIANDAHAEGAQNHQPHEGSFLDRKAAATKAYYEWLPVREGGTLYRQFSFGGVADLFMLDERAGRDKPTDSKRHKNLFADRSMLGREQSEWLRRGMKSSSATWKVLGNQVLFAELNVVPVFRKAYVLFDAWDGYPAERQAIKDFIAENEIQNTLIATGDTHASWCFDIPLDFEKYRKRRSGRIVAHEFATPSISSANFDEYKGEKTVDFLEKTFSSPNVNPHLRYLDLRNHGYLLFTLTPYDAVAEWRFVSSVQVPTDAEFVGEKRVLRAERVEPAAASGEASLGSGK